MVLLATEWHVDFTNSESLKTTLRLAPFINAVEQYALLVRTICTTHCLLKVMWHVTSNIYPAVCMVYSRYTNIYKILFWGWMPLYCSVFQRLEQGVHRGTRVLIHVKNLVYLNIILLAKPLRPRISAVSSASCERSRGFDTGGCWGASQSCDRSLQKQDIRSFFLPWKKHSFLLK